MSKPALVPLPPKLPEPNSNWSLASVLAPIENKGARCCFVDGHDPKDGWRCTNLAAHEIRKTYGSLKFVTQSCNQHLPRIVMWGDDVVHVG